MKKETKQGLAIIGSLVGTGLAILGITRVKAALLLTATLYGTVTDAETGLPIENIDVDCNGYPDTTAPDGTYRIEDIPPGEYSVLFTDPLNRYEPLTI